MKDIMMLARECGLPDPMVFRGGYERFATLVRSQALEDAAEAATDAVAFNGGSVQMEAHVRRAIRKMKEDV